MFQIELLLPMSNTRNYPRSRNIFLGKPLSDIAIPGTHNSATHAIVSSNKDCTISPDFPVASIKSLERVIRPAVIRISQAQKLDIRDQLDNGIRYLDLRVATRPSPVLMDGVPQKPKQELWICHGVYSVTVASVIDDVADFLNMNQKEIVIVDFQHFYGMTKSAHRQLCRMLVKKLGHWLTSPASSTKLSIGKLWKYDKRVVVFYGNDRLSGEGSHHAIERYDHLWRRDDHFESFWPDTMNKSKLQQKVSAYLSSLLPGPVSETHALRCSQVILTPRIATILSLRSLRKISKDVNKRIAGWLKEWLNCADSSPNIIMIDHFETCQDFVSDLIEYNKACCQTRGSGDHTPLLRREDSH